MKTGAEHSRTTFPATLRGAACTCLFLTLFSSAACGPPAPHANGDGGAPTAIVGSGAARFVSLQADTVVPIIFGPQAGYNVYGSVLVHGVKLNDLMLTYTLSYVDTGAVILASPEQHVDLSPMALADLPDGTTACGAESEMGAGSDLGADMTTAATDMSPSSGFCLPGGLDGWGERLGDDAYLPNDQLQAATNRALRIRLDGTDSQGLTFSDERTFITSAP